MLSMQRPRPSMLIAICRPANSPVNFSEVNCDPWSLLKMSGSSPPQSPLQSLDAEVHLHRQRQRPTQHEPAEPIHDRHQIHKPCAMRIYVISVLQTWLTRSTVVPLNKYG